MQKVSIVGAGAFGTAIANHLSTKNQVRIWSYEKKVVAEINKLHKNLTFLPSVELNPKIEATGNLEEVINFGEIIVNATPVFAIRETYKNVNLKGKLLVNTSKGIERGSHKLCHEIFLETLAGDYNYAVLSGPSFAVEVGKGLDTFVSIATLKAEDKRNLRRIFEAENFKIQILDDIVGVELSGALKNVLAIASGIASGAEFGKNFQAAVFVQGLKEMSSLGERLGAKKETFYSMAGLGDLFLTSTSDESRNFNFGFRLGKGESLREAWDGKTVEGAGSAESAFYLSEKNNLKTEIFKAIYGIIFEQKDPKESLQKLWVDI
jgi:glycerol-3-phosphate dehydrogenase (NAD(P)+)